MKTLYVSFYYGDRLGERVIHTFLDGFTAPKTKAEVRAVEKAISKEMQGGLVTPISWYELDA